MKKHFSLFISILAVALLSATPVLAQEDDCPALPSGYSGVTLIKVADFTDVTGQLAFFEGKLRCGDIINAFTISDGSVEYSANLVCKMKKGEILYYTDFSGATESAEVERNFITIGGYWVVGIDYFADRPTTIPDATVGTRITKNYTKYYLGGGDNEETGNATLNKDLFLGNVANNMWLVATADSYVMLCASANSTESNLKELDPYSLDTEYAFSVQHIGLFKSFELYPSDGVHSTFADWVKDQAFSASSSPIEVLFRLSNDISCHAVDSYDRTINLDCPQFAWTVDLEKGTATYTPYFAPKQGASYQLSGDPQLCNIVESASKNKTVLLWGENAGGDVTDITDADASEFSARGGSSSLILSGVSESAKVFTLAGVKVLDVAADGNYPLAAGAYVVKSGSKAQLVTVR